LNANNGSPVRERETLRPYKDGILEHTKKIKKATDSNWKVPTFNHQSKKRKKKPETSIIHLVACYQGTFRSRVGGKLYTVRPRRMSRGGRCGIQIIGAREKKTFGR